MGKLCCECGHVGPEDARFCEKCGLALILNRKSVPQPISSAKPSTETPLRSWYANLSSGERGVLWVLALTLVFVYGVGLIGVAFLVFLEMGQSGSSSLFAGNVILGAHVRNLSAEETRKAGSNHGVIVMRVVPGSPAFMANVLAGDTLKSIDGASVHHKVFYTKLLGQSAGKRVALGLVRDGRPISIVVQLNR